MDSLSTGIVRIVIEDAGGTSPASSGRSPSSKGGSYDPNAAPRQSAPPDRSSPGPLPGTPSMAEKIAAILKDPGAKRSLGKDTSAAELAKIGPEFVDLLFDEISRAKTSPVGPAPTANSGGGGPNAREWEITGHKLATGFLWKALALPVMLDQIGQKLGMGFLAKVNAVGLKSTAPDVVRPSASAAPTPILAGPSAAAPGKPVSAGPKPTITPVPLPVDPAHTAPPPPAPPPSPQDARLQELFDQFDKGALLKNEEQDELDKLYLDKIGAMTQDDRVGRLRSIIDRINGGERVKDSEWYERDKLGADAATNAAARIPAPAVPSLTSGFGLKPANSPWDAVMKNANLDRPFGLNPTPEQPKPKLPRARAVNPEEAATDGYGMSVPGKRVPVEKPRAEPISDAEKSREQWKPENLLDDFKGYLPAGLGKKLDVMKGAYSAASKQAGAQGAGMAGRAAAGAGEAALAAGPVAAFAAVAVAAHLSAKAHQKAADAVEGMGNQAARFAANDHMGMFNAAVDGAKDTLREIPIVGEKYAAELSLAVAPLKAFTTAVTGFVARGKELQGMSGSLAGANARADVRSLMGDLREAKELGPALARLTDATSAADEKLREELLPIKKVLVEKLAMIADAAVSGWEFVRPIFVEINSLGNNILDAIENLGTNLPLIGDAFEEWVKEERRGRELDRKRRDLQDRGPIVDWLNAADQLGRDPWQQPFSANNGNAAQRQVAGPMFPGFEDVLGL